MNLAVVNDNTVEVWHTESHGELLVEKFSRDIKDGGFHMMFTHHSYHTEGMTDRTALEQAAVRRLFGSGHRTVVHYHPYGTLCEMFPDGSYQPHTHTLIGFEESPPSNQE